MNEKIIELILVIAILITITGLIILKIIERRISKIKIKSRNEIFLEKLEKEIQDPLIELENINQISRDFFKEAFKLKKLDYVDLEEMFKEKGDNAGVEFCRLITKILYIEEALNPQEIKSLKNYLIEIVKNNKILSEEEEIELIKNKKIDKSTGDTENKTKNQAILKPNPMNKSDWDSQLITITTNKNKVDKILFENYPLIQNKIYQIQKGEKSEKNLTPEERKILARIKEAKEILKNIQLTVTTLFNQAYKSGTLEEKEYLKKLTQNFNSELTRIRTIKEQSKSIQDLIHGLQEYGKYKFSAKTPF